MDYHHQHKYHPHSGEPQFSGDGHHHNYYHHQTRHEFSNEFVHHPREHQHLLHQISSELMARHHHQHSVERDRHHNVTGLDFGSHNIYGEHHRPHHGHHLHHGYGHGYGYGEQHQHHSQQHHHYPQHHHYHHLYGSRHHQQNAEETADTSTRPVRQSEQSYAPPPPGRYAEQRQDPNQSEYLRPNQFRNPFVDFGREVVQGIDKVGHKIGDGIGHVADEIGHDLEKVARQVGDKMARLASSVADRLGTVGDCAHGPRLVFDKMGYHLPPMKATDQGRAIRASGLFDEVSPRDVRPGDYGVRDWNSHVIRQHGYNAGDSFIVSSIGRNGQIYQANDHHQAMPPDGGRYRNLHFYRPNERFYAMMREKGLV